MSIEKTSSKMEGEESGFKTTEMTLTAIVQKKSASEHILETMEKEAFHYFIILLVLIDLVILMVEQVLALNHLEGYIHDEHAMELGHEFLFILSCMVLLCFVIEITIKIVLMGKGFLHDKLNLVDTFVIGFSLPFEIYLHLTNSAIAQISAPIIIVFRFYKVLRGIHHISESVEIKNQMIIQQIRDEKARAMARVNNYQSMIHELSKQLLEKEERAQEALAEQECLIKQIKNHTIRQRKIHPKKEPVNENQEKSKPANDKQEKPKPVDDNRASSVTSLSSIDEGFWKRKSVTMEYDEQVLTELSRKPTIPDIESKLPPKKEVDKKDLDNINEIKSKIMVSSEKPARKSSIDRNKRRMSTKRPVIHSNTAPISGKDTRVKNQSELALENFRVIQNTGNRLAPYPDTENHLSPSSFFDSEDEELSLAPALMSQNPIEFSADVSKILLIPSKRRSVKLDKRRSINENKKRRASRSRSGNKKNSLEIDFAASSIPGNKYAVRTKTPVNLSSAARASTMSYSKAPPPLNTSRVSREGRLSMDPPRRTSADNPIRPSIENPGRLLMENPIKPSLDIPLGPSMDNPRRPSMDNPSRPSMDNPRRPSMDIPSRPSMDIPSRPSIDIPSRQSIDNPNPPRTSTDRRLSINNANGSASNSFKFKTNIRSKTRPNVKVPSSSQRRRNTNTR